MRKRAPLPDHLFAPKPIRILAIIQLCIAFIALGWISMDPFLETYFSKQSQILLIQTLTGERETQDPHAKAALARNRVRFEELSPSVRSDILHYETLLQTHHTHSFSDTAKIVFDTLFFHLSAFAQAWLFFSIAICILILLRIEGATHAAWVLPLILCFNLAYDAIRSEEERPKSQEEMLFPTEAVIVKEYLKKPLGKKVEEQREQLKRGWQLYLVDRWAHQNPSSDEQIFKLQVEEGEFMFAMARLSAQREDAASAADPSKRASFGLLLAGILWSLFFAWRVNAFNKAPGRKGSRQCSR